jgi:DnaK suppressor protein
MTPEQLDHFRQKLLEQRDEINERILVSQRQAQDVVDPLEDPEDVQIRSDLADTSLRVATMLTSQHHEIEDALLRIQLGEYGVCEVCGKQIELARLEVQPAARLCENDARRADVSHPPKL